MLSSCQPGTRVLARTGLAAGLAVFKLAIRTLCTFLDHEGVNASAIIQFHTFIMHVAAPFPKGSWEAMVHD